MRWTTSANATGRLAHNPRLCVPHRSSWWYRSEPPSEDTVPLLLQCKVDGYAEICGRVFQEERRLEFGGHMDPGWQEGHAISASFVAPVEATVLREGLKL